MGGAKTTGKTIGEAENLTGIPKRKLKYMIGRNIFDPALYARLRAVLRQRRAMRPRQEAQPARTIRRWPGSIDKNRAHRETHPTKKAKGLGGDGEDLTGIGPGQRLGKGGYQVVA